MPEMEPYKANALFDYSAEEDAELDMKIGDTFLVEEENDSGWLFASIENGKSGWIPAEYVERIVENAGQKEKPDSAQPLNSDEQAVQNVQNLLSGLSTGENQSNTNKQTPAETAANHNKGVDFQQKALAAFNTGEFADAAENFKSAAELFEDNNNKATMYANRGAALSKLKRNDDACIAYEEALKAKPDHFQSLHNRGVSLRSLGRSAYALDAFSEAVKVNPGYYASWCGKCDILTDLQRFEEAVESANAAIELEPMQNEAYVSRAVANYNMGKYPEAILDFDKVASIGHGEESKALHVMTLCNLGQQHGGDEGVALLDKAIALQGSGDPGASKTLRIKATVLAKADKKEAAATCFREVLKLNPADMDANIGLGNVLISMKDFSGAIEVLSVAVASGSPISTMSKPDVHFNIGVAHYEMKNLDKAKASFQKALEEDSGHELSASGLKAVAQAATLATVQGFRPTQATQATQATVAPSPFAPAPAPAHAQSTKTAAEVYQERKAVEEKEAKEAKEEETGLPVYPLAELLKTKGDLPAGVDHTKLEKYLSKEEFYQVFKMSSPAFHRMPRWRQQHLKRSVLNAKMW